MTHRNPSRPFASPARLRRAALRAFVTALALTIPALAQGEGTPQTMQGLDEQVQEIKSEVLAISAELGLLEEKLLFPSNTQVSVFVKLDEPETLELSAIRIEIDGEVVTQHVYGFDEVQALRKGGVQRLYTGNVPIGTHALGVFLEGRDASGAALEASETLAFEKGIEPGVVGIELDHQTVGGVKIALGEWAN